MYPLISLWTILSGHEAQAIHALKNLAIAVEKSQPETLAYLVHTPDFEQPNLPTPPQGQVVFFEVYKDKAAFLQHVNGAVFKNFVKEFQNLFLASNGSPYTTIEVLTHQAGYIRPGLFKPTVI